MLLIKTLTLISSSLILLSSHPLLMIISIMATACLSSLPIFTVMGTSWFSYMLILAFLGGLLIIFVYIASLIPNEMMTSNYKKVILLIAATTITISMMSNQSVNMNPKINLFFISSWPTIIMMLLLLIISLVFISNMIYNPFSPLKSN